MTATISENRYPLWSGVTSFKLSSVAQTLLKSGIAGQLSSSSQPTIYLRGNALVAGLTCTCLFKIQYLNGSVPVRHVLHLIYCECPACGRFVECLSTIRNCVEFVLLPGRPSLCLMMSTELYFCVYHNKDATCAAVIKFSNEISICHFVDWSRIAIYLTIGSLNRHCWGLPRRLRSDTPSSHFCLFHRF